MELADKEVCSGCHACFNACPKHCITMTYDEDGFLQPNIDTSICIECGKCKAVCPVLKDYNGNPKGKAFACINNNDNIRIQSSSGGVFTLIAEYVLDNGGVVFGAAFDDELNVKHIEVSTKKELNLLRGSKYLQSEIGDSFIRVKEYLENGKLVLFTGTPCQISGLKAYLNKAYDNLIMQDLICHGVPSPKVWQIYLRYQSKKHKSQVDRESIPVFRKKDEGWQRFSVSLSFINGAEYCSTFDRDLFMNAFLSNICLRLSCYNCHSKSLNRESDITLADFWGVDNVIPELFDDIGTSLVLVNSKKGMKIFEYISQYMKCRETDIDVAVSYNLAAKKSSDMPKNRNKFMKYLNSNNFAKLTNKYSKAPFMLRLKIFVKKVLIKFIR